MDVRLDDAFERDIPFDLLVLPRRFPPLRDAVPMERGMIGGGWGGGG